MNIKEEYPPNYVAIVSILGNCEEHKPIFAFGSTIYNPFKVNITPDLEVHEEVHSKQQGALPEIWWSQYLNDPKFRLDQELEAYAKQYAFAKKHIKGGKILEWALERMSFALSGDLYGNLISFGEAKSKIRNLAENIEI